MAQNDDPHDHLFKLTFSRKENAQIFSRKFLPKELVKPMDLKTFRRVPGNYLTPELKEFFSDIVYECQYGKSKVYISLLFEHKSYVTDIPRLQLLRYMLEGMSHQLSKNKEEKKKAKDSGKKEVSNKLNVIIPIIIYHGKRKWIKRDFEDHFKGVDENLKPFIPSFDYILVDLAKFDDDTLNNMKLGLLYNSFMMLKHAGDDEYLEKNIEKMYFSVENHLDDEGKQNLILTFFVYLYKTGKRSDKFYKNLVKRLPKTIKTEAMTAYESIILKGERRGERKGKLEEQNMFITNAFKEGLGIEMIAKLTNLTKQKVIKRLAELGLTPS